MTKGPNSLFEKLFFRDDVMRHRETPECLSCERGIRLASKSHKRKRHRRPYSKDVAKAISMVEMVIVLLDIHVP